MRNIKVYMSMLILVLFTLVSCSTQEGPGGSSEIYGRVWVRDYNSNFTILNAQYWAEEEDVYLMYGTDTIYSDRFKTNYDGSYWFQYLYEGDYTIYVYSKDSTFKSESGRKPIKQTIHIGGKDESIEVPTITILK